jgi:aminocarboxymuconate-semialdehyde decarboxylase
MDKPGAAPDLHAHSPGCACGVDIHAHVVPASFPRYLGSQVPADWPSMAPAQECHQHVMISGKIYRTVSDRCWDVSKRIADIDQMGLSLQVVSPMPELLSYWMQPQDAAVLLRYINDQIAGMIAEAGGRLQGFGAVPLQDIGLAIAELDYIVNKLGFAGVEVGSNINGRPIGAPEFAPFFEAAEAMGAAVFVHALKPCGMDRLVGPGQLQQALAYPTDVGLAAASVLTTGLIERHPALRIAFSHGGGTLAMLLPRLEQARKVFPPLAEAIVASPTEQARKLFYDALTFDAATLRHLVGTFGASQIILGTDYPFAFREKDPRASLEAAGFDAQVRDQLLYRNAGRFLSR